MCSNLLEQNKNDQIIPRSHPSQHLLYKLRLCEKDSVSGVIIFVEMWSSQGIKDAELVIMDCKLLRKHYADGRNGDG